MNKQRQEELEHNVVADGLVNFYKKIEPYSKAILTVFVLAVTGFVAYGLYTSGETAKRSDATLQLLMNNEEVALQYPGTVAANWSLVYLGNQNLALGINELYQDRDEAETLLALAQDNFKDARGASEDPILISRANLGLGLAAESLGDIEEAIEAYERCAAANESEQMVEVAEARIERLSDPDNQEFLAWFGAQDFAPADPSLPPELPGASSLPDLPDLELPDLSFGDDDDMEDSDPGEEPEPVAPLPENDAIELPESGDASEADAPKADSADSSEAAESADAPESTESESAEPAAAESDESADE